MQVVNVGLELANCVFHIRGTTEDGQVAFNRPLRRAQVLLFFERLGRASPALGPRGRATTGRASCRNGGTQSG